MGKIKQGILGGFSGKVGNVIGTSWKGISVVKVMPQSVANPKTGAQIARRSKLTNTVNFATAILAGFIKPVWDRFAQQMSGYNAFISANIELFANELPSDYSKLVTSRGKLDKLGLLSFSIKSTGEVHIEWTEGSEGTYGSGDDEVYAVFINQNTGEVVGTYLDSSHRGSVGWNDGLIGFEPAVGNTVHCYVTARRADGTMVSDCEHRSAVATA